MRAEAGKDNFGVLAGEFGRAALNLIDRPIVTHVHTQYNWIIKLDGADAEFRNETDRWLLDDNTILIFNPMAAHAFTPGTKPTLILSMLIEPAWIEEILAHEGIPSLQYFPKSKEFVTDEIRHLALIISTAISQKMRPESKSTLHLLREVATAMIKSYYKPEKVDCFRNGRPNDFRIRNALGFIRQNLSDCPSIEKIARNVGLSRSRFFEQFKGCMGVSPQHYIDTTRVNCATRRLTNSTASLAEISDELGFSQPAHFTRFFAQHTGVTPSTFRQNALLLNE